MNRRSFLEKLLTGTALIFSGLLRPVIARTNWNTGAFGATTETDALEKFYPGEKILPSDAISIGVYDTVENGAYVPVKINTELENVSSVAILVEKNPNPLIAVFHLPEQTTAFVATRIKMDTSSDIVAIIRSGDQLYSTRKFVEVLIGGCG